MGKESHHSATSSALARACGPLLLALAFAVLVPPSVGALAHGQEKHDGARAAATAASEADEARAAGADEALAGTSEAASPHAYPPEGVPRPLAWLGKLHPATTHFPIALLTMAAVAEALLIARPRELFRAAVRFCMWTGTLGALLAMPLGWFFSGFRLVDEDWIMTAHRWTGTGTALCAIIVLWLSERTARGEPGRGPLRLALLVCVLLVGATGFLGGSLIYGLDHYAW